MRAPVGGLFRHVADLTRELAARGHQVGIVADSLAGDAQTERKLDELSDAAQLGINRLPMPRLLGAGDITTPLKIRRLARSLNVSILHGHGAKGGFSARLAGWGQRDMARLYTPHGGALHYNPRTPTGSVFMAIERGLLRATDALIFESDHARKVFAEKVAQSACPQAVIHNGLAPGEFEPVLPATDAADFVFVGELRLLKGIDLLVEALAPLTRPDGAPATLVMAGDGPDFGLLREHIAKLGLQSRVTLAGARPARAMFARGRCVVVPSRAESLPYIVLEAAAAECPLIVTRVGGVPEIFGDMADRLVVPDSAESLRMAMADFLVASDRFAFDAKALRADVQERFSVARMTDEIEALYRRLARLD